MENSNSETSSIKIQKEIHSNKFLADALENSPIMRHLFSKMSSREIVTVFADGTEFRGKITGIDVMRNFFELKDEKSGFDYYFNFRKITFIRSLLSERSFDKNFNKIGS